jgi:hypothetical protein
MHSDVASKVQPVVLKVSPVVLQNDSVVRDPTSADVGVAAVLTIEYALVQVTKQ